MDEAIDEVYYKAISDNNIDVVVDPIFEVKTTDKILYNHIKNCKNIIVTNGSALSSLIILKPKSKIFCLNSKRYLPIWRKEIKNDKEYESIIKNNKDLLYDNFEKKIWYPTTHFFVYKNNISCA